MTSDTAATASKFYCTKVQTTDGASWFAGLDLNAKIDDASELMGATFNLTITDGQQVWIGQDLTEFSFGQTIVDSLKHALEALVQFRKPTEEYFLKFTEQHPDNALLVEIEWNDSRHGKDITPRLHVLLTPAADTAAALRELMGKISKESASLRLESEKFAATCFNLENAIQPDVKKLDSYASRKQELEEELALKGAALLVAKQQHLNELQHHQQR